MKLVLTVAAIVCSMSAWGQLQVAAPDTLNYDELGYFLAKNPQARISSAADGNIVVRLYKEIFYNIRESDNDTYQANAVLNQVGRFMQQFPESRVYAIGYADRGTGNYQLNQMYASRRALQFRSDLIRQYGVSPERIYTESNGDVVQPFRDNDRNRCVTIFGTGYLALEKAPVRMTAHGQAEANRLQFVQERDQLYTDARSRYAREPSRVDTIVISHQDTLWLGQLQDSLQLEPFDTLREERPFRCNRANRLRNWFFTLEGGPAIFQGDHNVDAEWKDRLYPSFNISFGKWFCPAIGMRVAVDLDMVHSYYNANAANPNPLAYRDGVFWYGEFVHGASPDEPYEKAPWLYRMRYNAWNFHGDLMVNLSSLMWRPYTRRIWNLIPYVGLGCIVNWDNGSHDWFNYGLCWDLGCINSFRVTEHFDINLDVRVKKFPDDFNCFRQGRSREGITNVMIGFTWHFTKRGF